MTEISKQDIQDYFNSIGTSPQIFNLSETETTKVNDICLIQSFYGNDLDRIAATTNALKALLRSTRLPSEWIFVEAQEKSSKCCFKWLENFGVKHVFVKIGEDQRGLFLKTPLWNIGAEETTSKRMCFVDSDVMFCNSSWLSEVEKVFDEEFEVLSLAGYCYNESPTEKSEIFKSIGCKHQLVKSGLSRNDGHYGFTIGMTRDLFERIGRFDCTCILDDLHYWSKIAGTRYMGKKEWTVSDKVFSGKVDDIGFTSQTTCHCNHGDASKILYRQITQILKDHIIDYSGIIDYDPANPYALPKWRNEDRFQKTISQAIKKCVEEDEITKATELRDGREYYFDVARNLTFKPGGTLVVATIEDKLSDMSICIKQIQDVAVKLGYDYASVAVFDDNDMFDNMLWKNVIHDVGSGTCILVIDDYRSMFSIDTLCMPLDGDIAFSEKDKIMYFKLSEKTRELVDKMDDFSNIKFTNLSKYIKLID